MKKLILFLFTISITTFSYSQTTQELKDTAKLFPPMPRATEDLIPFVQGQPTFASGAPFNDLDFTILDTDYMDGENSGGDVFMPVDPSDTFPGSNKVKYIRCVTNTDLNEVYNSANRDRIILGTHEIEVPFFMKGSDGIDNDYLVIQHLDFEAGAIQLKGVATDYNLIYCTVAEGCQTEGWYLFYTKDNNIDLIAFIFPCDAIESPLSGNPPNNLNPLCNSNNILSLTDPIQFAYAQPIETTFAVPNGIAQFGSDGKEVIGGFTVDELSNSYLFGSTDGNLDEDTDVENEIFIVKINSNGVQQWVTELPLSEGSMLKDGITDGQFLYVCGRTLGNLPGFTNAGRWDGILLKLDLNSGQIVAMDQWGNAGIDGYGNITQDDDGNIFVSAQGSPDGPAGFDDVYLVAKHSKANLSNIWRELNPPNTTNFISSAEAWGGLTYVPGTTPGNGRLIAGGWYFSNMGADAFVSVYENLNTSNPSRPHSVTISSQGARADWVLDNVVDNNGNIYVAGFTTGNLGSAPNGEGDAYLIKFSPQLTNPIYKQFGTPKSDLIRKLEIKDDVLYAVGYTYGNYIGTNADTNQESGDIFVQKFDTDLNPLTGIQFGTPHEDRAFTSILGDYLFLGGMTEGYMTGNSFGSFDGFVLLVNTSDLNFTQPILSIEEHTLNQNLNVYPNPIDNTLHIDIGSINKENVTMSIMNVVGQTIKQFKSFEPIIEFDNFTNGIYFLSILLDEKRITKKIIKK
ncbi:T9SS type A sorting domain-containing protein [uncultured Aquimarina sp.]|uniref:T9SS type A sorting domain-containing protein n=1 Tax=uncultured Aquimarina sp. TaxID=575652 RepID=UPI002624D174|nr:T9SS type A sorting domain-containing protein [uncultured Aquimarina sp.]